MLFLLRNAKKYAGVMGHHICNFSNSSKTDNGHVINVMGEESGVEEVYVNSWKIWMGERWEFFAFETFL